MIGLLISGWLDVRSKPLRTFTAIAGMIAAIVAVVLVDAAGTLSRTANDEYLARNYGLPVTMSIGGNERPPTLDEQARIERLIRAAGFTAVSRSEVIQLFRYGPMGLEMLSGQLVSSAYQDIRIVDLRYGAWPLETADASALRAVITVDLARRLGFTNPAEAVGQTIRYAPSDDPGAADIRLAKQREMVIEGVADTTTNAFDQSGLLIVSDRPDPGVLPEWRSFGLLVRANPADVGALVEVVSSVVGSDGGAVFRTTRVDQSESLAPVLEQQMVTGRVVTVVALTIGGLGILGVGIATVRERSREYGLRRALGASKLRIFAGVIVQTLMETLLAALAALFLAAILLEYFARDLVLARLPLPASTALPVSSATLGLTGALVVGLIAGLIPAITAARSSVVMALRS